MYRIKICGITNVEDARAAVAAGADAIGLNFYPRSKRYLDRATANQIAASTPAGVLRIGVFVNASAAEIADAVAQTPLDGIQLHGDEPVELLAQLPPHTPVVRAFRCGAPGLAPLAEFLSNARTLGRPPAAVLLDADAAQEFGGSGRLADWSRIALERSLLGNLPLLLGGGLTPANVAAAIQTVRPAGVDVASGVERAPGIKDAAQIKQFIAAAQAALDQK